MRSLILLFTTAALVAAQTTLPLSLKRAVEIALAPEGNVRLALAQESMKQAESKIAEARAAFLPVLDASVQDRSQTTNLRAFGFSFVFPPGLLPAGFGVPGIVGPYSVFDARATAQQSVLDFSNIRRFQASKSAAAASKSDVGTARDQVSDQVARAYIACLRADAALETARANVQLSEALLKLAQTEKTAGTGTGIEVTRAQVQLSNDRGRLTVAENDRRRAQLQLLKVMGLRLDVDVEPSDKLSFQPVDPLPVQTALQKARSERVELKAQQQREQTARLNYDAVRAERLPSLAAFADYGSIGSEIVGSQPTHTYGITLKVPVFDGGRREARRAESLSQFRQEKLRTLDLEDQIELEVRLALDSLVSGATQVAIAREGLSLAEDELAQARRRYEAGVTNSIEVTDAQTRLIRARDNLIAALYAHNLARLDLATATGNIQEYVQQ
jgi:outer membrane protein TolC